MSQLAKGQYSSGGKRGDDLNVCERRQCLMFTPMGRALVGGQVSQVNNLAGEEAVERAMVLAYVPCFRDTSKYAKPEVDLKHQLFSPEIKILIPSSLFLHHHLSYIYVFANCSGFIIGTLLCRALLIFKNFILTHLNLSTSHLQMVQRSTGWDSAG